MKNIFIGFFLIGLYTFYYQLFFTYERLGVTNHSSTIFLEIEPEPSLKATALAILKTKCNVCHKKRNPFKIFSLKNMNRHARKINKQVFVYRRMPKGNQVKLSDEEYQILKNWINKTLKK